MEDHLITIRLLAPLGTPWQSDTVFGHIAWHYAYGRGPGGIEEFLEPFRAGEPSFVLSDGFPHGALPRPLLPSAVIDVTTPAEYALAKSRLKARWVSTEDFGRLVGGESHSWQPVRDPWVRVQVPHAAVNRLTESTTGTPEQEAVREAEGAPGNVFVTDLWALEDPCEPLLDLYLRATPEWADRVLEALEWISHTGFGRDRGTGCGAFEVVGIKSASILSGAAKPNGFVSLSSYCPAAADPTDGHWRLRLKRGKLGEAAGGDNPFKRPLLQMEPGAVFWTDAPLRPFYGRVIEGLAPAKPEAIQNCYTLAVPARLPYWKELAS
jgi:CRISPR-associated protein Csm4